MLGCTRQGRTYISPGQGTGEEAAPALGHVSCLMVAAPWGHVAGLLLALLQCGMIYNENKTHSFISPILQTCGWHSALHLALGPDCSWVKAHLLCLQLNHCASGSAAGLSPNMSVLAGATAPLLG